MADNDYSLSIRMVIRRFDSDLSKCKTCEKEIIGNMYRMVLIMGPDEEVFEKTSYCGGCRIHIDIPEG